MQEVLHAGFSLVSDYGRGKGRKKFFTPYLYSRRYFLQSSEEHREAKPVQEVLHIGFSLVSDSAEEKVARSSSHLIYIPADIFSNLKRTPGGETGARGSSRRIFSRLGLRQRKRSQEVLHTLFIFPPIFSPALREHREAKPLQEVLHA